MKPNPTRSWTWLAWLLGVFLFLLLIVSPLLTSALIQYNLMPRGMSSVLDVIIQIQAYSLRAFTIVWIFFVGGCFASFLNVVAWRVPRGRSILGSSHCPYCNTKLAFRDNLPIIGWLKNRGRCRICRLPISPRYLIAEIVLGSIFLLLAIVQLNGGGINLPFRPTDAARGFENLLFEPKWDLILLLLYFLTLLSFLFTYALVKSDGLAIPRSLFLIPLLLGMGLPLIWPGFSVVSWQNEYQAIAKLQLLPLQTLATSLIGAAAGLVIGWLLQGWLNRNHSVDDSPSQFAMAMCVVGIFLGWQSVLSVSIFFLVFRIVLEVLSASSISGSLFIRFLVANPFALMLLATLVHLLSWRAQTAIPGWLSIDQAGMTLVMGIATVVMLALLGSWFQLQREREEQVDEIGHE